MFSSTTFSPRPASAAPVAVGLGSYNTTLPAGGKVPDNSTGTPVTPKKTANVTGAMPTNKWWSSLAWQRYAGNPYSENMYAHPLALRAKAGGLGVSYPTNPTISTGNPTYIQEYHYSYAEDLMLGVAGLNAPDAKVDGFSDWTVTAAWSDGTRSLKTTFGHGLPFVYATKSGGNALIVFNGTPTVWSNGGNVLGVTVNGHHYGIFAPTGSTWTLSGTTLQSTLAGKSYYSVAVLPDNTTTTLNFFKNHAFAFVTGSTASWSYGEATAQLTTNYNVTTSVQEGTETRPLLALYRHQWLNTSAALTGYSYISPRGAMKVLQGASFSTGMRFNGVLPALPDKGSYNRTTLYNYVNEVYAAGSFLPNGTGTYWTGKALGRLSALAQIAHQVGHTAARDAFLSALKSKLQDWFQAPDGKTSNLFHYNSTWGTLIGYPAEYGSDTELNDHHFHYAYYVMAAATIAQYDPNWAIDSNWGGMVKLLIKDAANWESTETRFPRLRSYDAYAGHAWASGHGGFGAGNNQESSSESINFSTSLILWGSATGNKTIRDLGIYLYTNEVNAIEQYWFDVNDAVFPAGFNRSTVGIVWGDGGAYSTWWTANPEEIHGINFLPITGGSLYLGRNPNYIATNYNDMRTNNGGDETEWRDIIWSYYALYDAAAAVNKFNANAAYAPEGGESKAHTYHWIHNLNAMGRLDPTITANVPTYAVFNKAGTRTYVAYNYGSTAITVTFSNGTTLSVPARSFAAGSGSSGGDTQAPTAPTNLAVTGRTNSSISLSWTASTDNVGVTGYDIYNGTALAGSSTGTSYTVTGLAANTTYSFTVRAKDAAGNVSAASAAVSATTTGTTTPQSNTLYVIDGAATTTPSALAFSAGAAAATDTIASAGGGNYDGTPNNPLVYTVSGVSGTYDSTKTTGFNMYLDAGANVADGSQVRISYDFTGDGTYDRLETYNYFATNDIVNWELYSQARGLKSASGTFGNLSNGRIRLEIWNAIGTHTVALRTSATTTQGSQSLVTIPFTNVQQ
jgi:endoglucanase Acf2/chitodextrinase